MSGIEIVDVRPGVQFTPDAAASFRRAESAWGKPIDVNSTYRDWDTQMSMYLAWQAWVAGTGPKPAHSRAIHPKYSRHTSGLALDTDDWTKPGFIDFMAEHGWIRTAAADPTEQHHFEYQWWRDQHRDDPDPTTITLEDDMILIESLPERGRAVIGPGYFRKLNNAEELAQATHIVSKQLKGNARQFDVWKSLALAGAATSTIVTLTDDQLAQIEAAARDGGADAIAGLEFIVTATRS